MGIVQSYIFQNAHANKNHKKTELDYHNHLMFKKIKSKNNTETAVLFCHGNAVSVDSMMENIFRHMNLDSDVYLFEYRGYGENKNKKLDASMIRDDLRDMIYFLKLRYENIIMIGHSLGTGILLDCIDNYYRNENFLVILLSPFISISKIYFSFNIPFTLNYDNEYLINNIKSKVVCFHGYTDSVISFNHSRQLTNDGDDRELYLVDSEHDDIIFNITFVLYLKQQIKKFNFCVIDVPLD